MIQPPKNPPKSAVLSVHPKQPNWPKHVEVLNLVWFVQSSEFTRGIDAKKMIQKNNKSVQHVKNMRTSSVQGQATALVAVAQHVKKQTMFYF